MFAVETLLRSMICPRRDSLLQGLDLRSNFQLRHDAVFPASIPLHDRATL